MGTHTFSSVSPLWDLDVLLIYDAVSRDAMRLCVDTHILSCIFSIALGRSDRGLHVDTHTFSSVSQLL